MNIILSFQDEMWYANKKSGGTLKTNPSFEAISSWATKNRHNVVAVTGMEIESVEDLIRATDFGDLRKQKQIAVKAAMGEKLTPKEADELNGLVNFLDSFQDMCVDVYGISKKRVFPKIYK